MGRRNGYRIDRKAEYAPAPGKPQQFNPSALMLDSELFAFARAGEASAFEALFNCYYQRISLYLIRMVGNEAIGYELTQETFLKAWQALPVLQKETLQPAFSLSSGWVTTVGMGGSTPASGNVPPPVASDGHSLLLPSRWAVLIMCIRGGMALFSLIPVLVTSRSLLAMGNRSCTLWTILMELECKK